MTESRKCHCYLKKGREQMSNISLVQLLLGICVGVSLSAACGFRIFVPMLVASVGVHFFGIHVNESLQWVGSWTALVVLSTATICEMFAYYIPWIDNALDLINTPLALLAGTVLMSGMLPELNPCLKWCIAGVLGSGAAGVTKVTSAVMRSASTATTGGLGNNLVSTAENFCSTAFSILAFIIPVITFTIVIVSFVAIFLITRKLVYKARQLRLNAISDGR